MVTMNEVSVNNRSEPGHCRNTLVKHNPFKGREKTQADLNGSESGSAIMMQASQLRAQDTVCSVVASETLLSDWLKIYRDFHSSSVRGNSNGGCP
jgi:hypothetical protein